VEDRSLFERHQQEVHARVAQSVEFGRPTCQRVRTDDRRRREAKAGRRQRRVGDTATKAPAAWVVGRDVSAGRADMDDVDGRAGHGSSGRILRDPTPTDGAAVFFYELHEGDDEVFADVLVVSESEWEPQEFFELVQRVRRDVQHSYTQDTLIEAIAEMLERDHGFIYVSDDRLMAAVNVSTEEADNFLTDLEPEYDDEDRDEDDDEEPRGDYRTVVTEVEFDLDDSTRRN
jgi:hypothetical protein